MPRSLRAQTFLAQYLSTYDFANKRLGLAKAVKQPRGLKAMEEQAAEMALFDSSSKEIALSAYDSGESAETAGNVAARIASVTGMLERQRFGE